MSGFLLNENLPASLARALDGVGERVAPVSELGLAGGPDSEICSRSLLGTRKG